jgi:DNA-binding NtrC family response regulator
VKPHILIVDDDPGTLDSLSRAFALEGYVTLTAGSAERAIERLGEEQVDAILTDVVMPRTDGIELLRQLKERAPAIPVIVMSGQATLEAAIEATRLGALDFVEKPVGLDRLLLTLRNALRLDRLQRENQELQRYWREELALIGDSPPMEALRRLIERAAPSDVPILVLGENGTGKELVARAVHELSPRRSGRFVKMNTAAVPAELVESELFGHEKGAFSGAAARRRGRFEQADGGTLFLDEIGDMTSSMQAKLLRVLQDGELTRVGGNEELRVDVRVISATNRRLDELVESGAFREDLYYRINTLAVNTPPLRERPEDVPALCTHFAEAACRRNGWRTRRIDGSAADLLRQQPWRGNVRELRNVIERACILADGDFITERELALSMPSARPVAERRLPGAASDAGASEPDLLVNVERDHIQRALARSGGNKKAAAKMLGLSRRALYRRLERLNLAATITRRRDALGAMLEA